jgi:hypothetical protein
VLVALDVLDEEIVVSEIIDYLVEVDIGGECY